MFCPFCGNQVQDGSTFCMKCGNRVAGNASQPAQQPLYTPPAPQPAQQPLYTPPVQPAQQPLYTPPVQPAPQPAQQPLYTPPAPQPAQQPLYTPPAPQPAYSTPTPPPVSVGAPVSVKVGGGFVWVKVMAIVAAVVAVVGVAAFFLWPKSDEAKIRDRIDSFVEACNDGDIEGVFNSFDKQTRKTYETMTSYGIPIDDMMKQDGMGGKGIEIEVLSIEIEDGEAVVEIQANVDGESEEDEIVMCEEDGEWYIDYRGTIGESLMGSMDGMGGMDSYW